MNFGTKVIKRKHLKYLYACTHTHTHTMVLQSPFKLTDSQCPLSGSDKSKVEQGIPDESSVLLPGRLTDICSPTWPRRLYASGDLSLFVEVSTVIKFCLENLKFTTLSPNAKKKKPNRVQNKHTDSVNGF